MAERAVELLDQSGAVTPELSSGLSPEIEEELRALNCLNDDALWAVARSRMILSRQKRWHRLLEKNQRGVLTDPEQTELARLTAAGDRLTLCKAQAYLLLKQRGHRVPELDSLRRQR